MSRLGVRGFATSLAMFAVTIAAILGIVLLLITLRGSLIDEIDRSNLSRMDDMAEQWDSENEFIALGAGFDTFTFAAATDATGYYETTDDSVDFQTLRDSVTDLGVAVTLELDTASDTGGSYRTFAVLADDPERVVSDVNLGQDDTLLFVASSLEPVATTLRRVGVGAAIVAPVFVILVGLLTWLLTARSLRSVEAIRTEVESISARGLDRRVPEPRTDDEVGRLASTMNQMLSRLEASHTAQQRFVSDASHELRSPLASMAAMLDVAERHGTAEDWPETAAGLQRETNRMRRMVDDLLLLARADGSSGPSKESANATSLIDLDDVVLDVVGVRPPTAGISIDTQGVSAGLTMGKPDELRRVVINLVDNAVRHASRTVRVSLGETDGRVRLLVEDDGPGIAAQNHERVFDRFVRLDDARAREAGGSGLGLAISREIATAHGGEITVGTSSLGGAKFTFLLPAHS